MSAIEFGRALYFPYIELGHRVSWLKMAALYYDSISRIVPISYHTWDPDEVQQLIDAGFIQKRSPKQAAQALAEEFYVFAADHLLDPINRSRLSSELHTSESWGQIHIDKIDRALAKALQQEALLRETDGEWYEVEPVTALLYMTFLAKKLAGSLPLISDDPASQRLAYGTHSVISPDGGPSGDIGYRIASAAIRTWVPVDIANVPMSAILAIRKEYQEERAAFYNAVGSLGKDLFKITDEADLQDAISQRQLSIGRPLDALKSRLDNHRLAARTGLLGISVPGIAKIAGVANPIALAGLGAICVGCVVWKYFLDIKSAQLENNWSYLMTVANELTDFDLNQHFTRLGLEEPTR